MVHRQPPAPDLEPADAAPAEGPGPDSPVPSTVLAVLRRWPWIAFGVVAGLVLGFLTYTQLPAIYQSSAQLLVIKNREIASPEETIRVAYVDDYLGTQVTLLQSQKILDLAAQQLDRHGPFNVPPPPDPAGRAAVIAGGFSVARRAEGSSSVLSLTFRASDPADAPKYLRAIIDAYRAELVTLYEEASTKRLAVLDADITTLSGEITKQEAERAKFQRDLQAISLEPLPAIKTRITANRSALIELRLRQRGVDRDIALVDQTSKTDRQERLAVLDRLGGKGAPAAPAATPPDPRQAEDPVDALEHERDELALTYGPDHPQMKALQARIDRARARAGRRPAAPGPAPEKEDELDRLRRRLVADREALADQMAELTARVQEDEKNATAMVGSQDEVDRRKAAIDRLDDRIKERRLEKVTHATPRSGGGYRAEAITPPGDGAKIAPVLTRTILTGGVLGLLVGCGLAFLAELSDRSFRTPAEIRQRLGVPVLGHVPLVRVDAETTVSSVAGLDRTLACFYRPRSAEAETVRGLRTQLYFSTQGRGHQVLQVTSPTPGDGKSTLVANLAISIAQSGKRVVLLDCDFRKPRIHKIFSIPNPEIGLASVVAGEARLEAAVRTTEVENLYVMPCGPRPANPAELLTSPKFQDLLAELKGHYDFVLVDTPPVLAVTDPAAVAPRVDGVLLVLRMRKHTRPSAERAREQLRAVGAHLLGVVVNACVSRSSTYGYGGYGGYGYGYGYGYSYQYDYQYSDHYAASDDAPRDTPAANGVPLKG